MTDHRNFVEDKRTSDSLVVVGSRRPPPAMMASTASGRKSSSDSDNHSCYAVDVTSSEERLFREMASVEFQSEDDQFEESRSRDEEGSRDERSREERSREDGSREEGSREEGDQVKEEEEESQLQEAQLSLVDDGASAFLSHPLTESDGEDDEDLDPKTSEVAAASAAADYCIKESGPQTESTKFKSWEFQVSSHKRTKRKSALYICLTFCKYDSVHRVAKMFGFKEVFEYEDWNLFWTDGCVTLSRMMDMKKFQKINHFPGMSEICRKDLLARNMNRMLKSFPKEYNIFPRTWCLPADYADFQFHARRRKHRTYIIKPESSCQGRGIWLTRKTKEVSPVERLICQVYISKLLEGKDDKKMAMKVMETSLLKDYDQSKFGPLLIDRLKFDFRIYVVVTSVDPFRIYVFRDGLARFATAKYVEPTKNNVANIYMHLTNYAINKGHNHYSIDDEAGSKRRISTVIRWLERNNGDVKRLWADIDDVIIKTLISAHSTLRQNYRSCFLNHDQITACFDILGFDILLDQKLKPYLLEVNHSPSFHTDTDLDRDIKETLLYDTLCLVNFDAVDRKQCIEEEKRRIMTRLTTVRKATDPSSSRDNLEKLQEKFNDEQLRYEETHLGNFRRIYPLEGTDRYNKFFCTSSSVYQETASFRAHTHCARLQREQIVRRKEELDILQKKKKEPAVRPESPDVKKPKAKQKIPEIATASKVPTPRPLPKTYYPQRIVPKEEMERINELIDREVLINAIGIVQFVRDMFSQSFENTSAVVEAPSSTSELPETLRLDEASRTSCKVAAASSSSAAAEAEQISITCSDCGKAFDPSVEPREPPAFSPRPPNPPPGPSPTPPPPPASPPPPLPSGSDIASGSLCSQSTHSQQSSTEMTVSSLSLQMLPCALCVSSTRPCDEVGMRTLKPLSGTVAYSRHSISRRSLNPLLRRSPSHVGGGSAGHVRHYERMLAQLPNQRELSMMLSLYRDPSSIHSSSLWNWPEGKLLSGGTSAAAAASADETHLEEKARSNKQKLGYQQRKQHKVAAKVDDKTLNNNKWLEISKLDLHKQFKPE